MHENELQRHKEERDILVEGVFTCDGTVYVALLDISSEEFPPQVGPGKSEVIWELMQKKKKIGSQWRPGITEEAFQVHSRTIN